MRKVILSLAILGIVCFTVSCSDKGGGGGGTTEANLAVTLNPPANSTQPALPQADFPITVTITSAMPPQGVTIEVKAAQDGSSTNFFTESKSNSGATTPFTITGTPVGPVCVATVTVTSKTKSTNTWTGSFRYSRKQ